MIFLLSGDYAFMGSLIIKEVVNELLTKGLDNAKVLLLAGSRSVLDKLDVFVSPAVYTTVCFTKRNGPGVTSDPTLTALFLSLARAAQASC